MRKALLVMTYGTPVDYTFEGVGQFFTNIRAGRRPTDEEISELHEKYQIIQSSPLQKISKDTVKKLGEALDDNWEIYFANKFSTPTIDDTIEKMVAEGIEQCLCLILEPHYSMYSLIGYEDRLKSEKIKFNIITSWHKEENLIGYWAEEITKKVKELNEENYHVIFTAHSVPEIALEMDDPYVVQIGETIDEIVKKIEIENLNFSQTWQSESKNGMEWIKPDVLDYLKEIGEAGTTYIFAPIGFISDHIETYYDIDFECRQLCESMNLGFHRINMPNDDDRLIKGLLSLVNQHKDGEYKIYGPNKLASTVDDEKLESEGKELKMPYFVKKLIEKKGKENVKMPEYVRKMLIKAGKIKE